MLVNDLKQQKLAVILAKFGEWLATTNYASRTQEDYLLSVKQFLSWIEENTLISSILQVTTQHLQQYQVALYNQQANGKRITPETQLRKLAAIRTFFRYLIISQQIAYNPASNLQLPLTKRKIPEVISKTEVRKLIDKTPQDTLLNIRDRAILELFYATAIRCGELLALSVYDVNLEKETLMIHKGKNGKPRLLPLVTSAIDALGVYLEKARPKLLKDLSNNSLFLAKRSGKALIKGDISQVIQRAVKRAKLKCRVTAHILRHSCATHLLKGKADLRYIQQLLGHTSIATTERYTKVEISDLRKVLKRSHPRERG
jgi:integrase/recombinase XerD